MEDTPKEIKDLLLKIQTGIEKVLQDFTPPEANVLPLYGTVFLTELGSLIDMVKKRDGIKEAKKLREIFAQRLHAYPLDKHEKTNDIH